MRMGREVAIKIPSPDLGQDDRFRESFLRESRVAARITHWGRCPRRARVLTAESFGKCRWADRRPQGLAPSHASAQSTYSWYMGSMMNNLYSSLGVLWGSYWAR
jgi:hypothetical protein